MNGIHTPETDEVLRRNATSEHSAAEDYEILADHAANLEYRLAMASGNAIRLRAFVESIVDASGPYPALNGSQIIEDAYATLAPQDTARTLASHRPPRYFRDVTTDDAWEWSNGKMTINHGEESIFASPGALLCCPGIIEVDEYGEPLVPSAEAIAAEMGDREQQREADES